MKYLLPFTVVVTGLALPSVADPPRFVDVPDAVESTRSADATVPPPDRDGDVFQFAIFGDRTGGVPEGLRVLEQAVADVTLIDPDLVMTVGDMIQGYNQTPQWLQQAAEYKAIMGKLPMRWFPVAGNHDVYWRGPGDAPEGEHESNYESVFGPLWYRFGHKGCGFMVLYSDEGDPATNRRDFHQPWLQNVSPAQMEFIDQSLAAFSDADHVFVFLHHPRWLAGYAGSNWPLVHQRLREAGNVTAVFAGHIHHMTYRGDVDGIDYHTLAATGGHIQAEIPGAGYLHQFDLVTVRPDGYSVAAVPVGAVIDPREFTEAFLTDVDRARTIRPVIVGDPLHIRPDGSAWGDISVRLRNPAERAVDLTLRLDVDDTGWVTAVDHEHVRLEPGESLDRTYAVAHPAGVDWSVPRAVASVRYLGEAAAVDLPEVTTPVEVELPLVPADYFSDTPNRSIRVADASSAVRVDSDRIDLPDDSPLTLECWIRPGRRSGYRAIVAKTQNSGYALFYDEGLVDFSVNLDGRYASTRSGDPVPADRWTHVAGVWDGGEVRLYVGGELVDSRGASGRRTTNELPLWIGADPDGGGRPDRPWGGDLDEVRLSRTAVYTGAFAPSRRLSPGEDTALLYHFDRRFGPYEFSHTSGGPPALLGATTEFIDP